MESPRNEKSRRKSRGWNVQGMESLGESLGDGMFKGWKVQELESPRDRKSIV